MLILPPRSIRPDPSTAACPRRGLVLIGFLLCAANVSYLVISFFRVAFYDRRELFGDGIRQSICRKGHCGLFTFDPRECKPPALAELRRHWRCCRWVCRVVLAMMIPNWILSASDLYPGAYLRAVEHENTMLIILLRVFHWC